ncbi:MAG: DNA mismatch repair endonuclease MutL [Acutalibacteraceae bacterium]
MRKLGRINVLDKHTSELIAAGEVVERPSSVIKELLENSIDAGATAITVEIKNGGIKYMRVTDNGAGFLKEDVPKAFLRHATSKVQKKDDLEAISTLGFRGEALASICAVAHVELLTCAKEEDIGTRYQISGGEQRLFEDAGCPNGSTIIVRDIFYNIPARMKFLKRDISEANAVSNVMDKISLSHPEVAFTFIRDGKQTLKTTGDGSLLSAIYSVYGREFASGLMPVDYSLNGIIVKGYISKPQNARPNRNMQNFFINGRFVKSRTAMAALEEACKGSVMVSKHPSCVLHITLPENTVDVNVHPAKIEVRFINERPVFDAVYHAVKTALMEKDRVKQVSLNSKEILKPKNTNPFSLEKTPFDAKPKSEHCITFEQLVEETHSKKTDKAANKEEDEPIVEVPKNIFSSQRVSDSFNPFDVYKGIAKPYNKPESAENIEAKAEEKKPEDIFEIPDEPEIKSSTQNKAQGTPEKALSGDENERNEFIKEQKKESTLKYVGEAFNTYIIIEKNEKELVLIDKHAAHERIIYEKLKKDNGQGFAQYLLVPVTVSLPKLEYDAVIQNLSVLSQAGFEIDDFGGGSVLVRSAPQYLEKKDIEQTVCEIAGHLLENKRDVNTEDMDWVYHSVACRAAIKAGNISKPQELMEIALKLAQDENLRYCPHGRPTSIIITKRELEKQFGRV